MPTEAAAPWGADMAGKVGPCHRDPAHRILAVPERTAKSLCTQAAQ